LAALRSHTIFNATSRLNLARSRQRPSLRKRILRDTGLALECLNPSHSIPQRALNHRSPVQALKSWQQKRKKLFVKRVHEQAGLDT
jgi:hypothetical protein